jgi:Na+-driven multidrug efflux pump
VPPKFSLTEGSIPRALLAFSLPVLFGNVLQSVNGSVNAIWVGKYLGEASLAAVGNSNVVMFLLFGVMFNLLIGGSLIMIVYVLDKHAVGLFLPANGASLDIAVHLNQVVVWSFAFFGTSMVLYGVVRATGAVMAPLIMLTIALWVVRVPFAYAMLDRLQADAIWWSFPLASVISMLMSIGYYRFGGWRNVRMGVATARAAPVPGV